MLNVKILKAIDDAIETAKPRTKLEWIVLDAVEIDKINQIPLAHSQPYLRGEYLKYYFKAKQHYQEEHAHPDNLPHYPVKFWEGC